MTDQYIRSYENRKGEGFSMLESFGIVASGIAVGGAFEDLKELDKHFQNDLFNKSEGLNNESVNRPISTAV